MAERSETGSGTRHRGALPDAKRRKLEAGRRKAGKGGAPADDPLKAAGSAGGSVFVRAPKKGESHLNEELTDMEKKAMEVSARTGRLMGRESGSLQ